MKNYCYKCEVNCTNRSGDTFKIDTSLYGDAENGVVYVFAPSPLEAVKEVGMAMKSITRIGPARVAGGEK